MESLMETIPNGPDRVIVDSGGLGVPPQRAREQYMITPDVIFLRGDKWALGAPKKYEPIAYAMWQESWTHFARRGEMEWTEIGEY